MPKNLETLPLFDQSEIYQITLTSFVEDFRARLSQLQEEEKALKIPEVLYFLKSHGFSDISETLKSQSPILYSKMLKAYLVTMMDEHLLSSTEFLPTLVIPLNANFLILGGYYPKIESEYTLSDILEEEVDAKYFLSESQHNNIIKNQHKITDKSAIVSIQTTTKDG